MATDKCYKHNKQEPCGFCGHAAEVQSTMTKKQENVYVTEQPSTSPIQEESDEDEGED